jgi:hypothetical protein
MKKIIVLALITFQFISCQESLSEKADREAKLYTKKNCPATMSDVLRMDSMTFEVSSQTLHYHYTLTGRADNEGTLNKEEARQALLRELKNTTQVAEYKEEGYNFAYTYHSEKSPQTILYTVTFAPKDYR